MSTMRQEQKLLMSLNKIMTSSKVNHNQLDIHKILNSDEEEEARQLFEESSGEKIDDQMSGQSEDESEHQQKEQDEEESRKMSKSEQNQPGSSREKREKQKQQEQLNRLKSILKKVVEKKESNKKDSSSKDKRVSFLFQQQEEERGNNYVVYNGERRWNEKLANPKKGKFDPEEQRLLRKSLSQCIAENNLSFEEVVRAMSEEDEKIPSNLHLWAKVCSILPDRSLVSSYKFLKRVLCTKNNIGAWTEEETELLKSLIDKHGRKWSLISRAMKRTPQNIRDKYRSIGEQNSEEIKKHMWSFSDLVKFLKYVQKYSGSQFLDEQIFEELQNSAKHDKIEQEQLRRRKYNSKSFTFHNNEVVRRFINNNYKGIKMEELNWKKISDKIVTKTVFDCRNKFVQLLQFEVRGMESKQFYEKKILDFVTGQHPKYEGEIRWEKWNNKENLSSEEAKNRWMILKRHIQGRGQKDFKEILRIMNQKLK